MTREQANEVGRALAQAEAAIGKARLAVNRAWLAGYSAALAAPAAIEPEGNTNTKGGDPPDAESGRHVAHHAPATPPAPVEQEPGRAAAPPERALYRGPGWPQDGPRRIDWTDPGRMRAPGAGWLSPELRAELVAMWREEAIRCGPDTMSAATLRECAGDLESAAPNGIDFVAEAPGAEGEGWRTLAPPIEFGVAVLAYGTDLIHPDFCPSGIVEAYFTDEGNWIGAVWDSEFDEWRAQEIHPTHWRPLPAAPEATGAPERVGYVRCVDCGAARDVFRGDPLPNECEECEDGTYGPFVPAPEAQPSPFLAEFQRKTAAEMDELRELGMLDDGEAHPSPESEARDA